MRNFVAVAMVSCCATAAFAEDPNFSIKYNALNYTMTNKEHKDAAGTSHKTKETAFTTFAGPIEIGAEFGDGWVAYGYPSQKGFGLKIGKTFIEHLEAGVSLGLNNTSVDKPKAEASSMSYGVWALYTLPMGMMDLEFGLAPSMVSGTKKVDEVAASGTTSAVAKVDLKTSGMSIPVSALALFGFGEKKSFEIGAGVEYAMDSAENKDNVTSTKETHSDTEINVVLSQFRYNF